ncbi:putative RNA-directed DNA polymerase from transposon X-element [Trichonephila clavipes]|nr:putative RNA-directed DNA polymerase from transposon X-element [Trichonephila clavipes]
MLNFEVAKDLHNSDHFPLLVSHVNGAGTRFRPPHLSFSSRRLGSIHAVSDYLTGTMVKNRAVDEAVLNVTVKLFGMLLMQPFPKHPIPSKAVQTMVERFLPTSQKEQRRAWGIFKRYPTTDNLIAFTRAKALARRIRRQCQRESWIQYVSSITSSPLIGAHLL